MAAWFFNLLFWALIVALVATVDAVFLGGNPVGGGTLIALAVICVVAAFFGPVKEVSSRPPGGDGTGWSGM